jgi:hypothetical protein
LKNLWIPRLATTQTAVILRVQVSAWDWTQRLPKNCVTIWQKY